MANCEHVLWDNWGLFRLNFSKLSEDFNFRKVVQVLVSFCKLLHQSKIWFTSFLMKFLISSKSETNITSLSLLDSNAYSYLFCVHILFLLLSHCFFLSSFHYFMGFLIDPVFSLPKIYHEDVLPITNKTKYEQS